MKRMIGQIPECIEVSENVIYMTFAGGDKAWFYHNQDCCEEVYIEDVIGDWNDLLGYPLLVAEARQEDVPDCDYGAAMWTFYTFRSVGGTVDVRWFGSSSGYYSITVDYEYRAKGERGPELKRDWK